MTPRLATWTTIATAAVALIVGVAIGNTTGAPPLRTTPATVVTVTATPRVDTRNLPAPTQVEAHLAAQYGRDRMSLICGAARWSCDIDHLAIPDAHTVVAVVEADADADTIARNLHHVLTTSTGSPLPNLTTVTVTSRDGRELATYRK